MSQKNTKSAKKPASPAPTLSAPAPDKVLAGCFGTIVTLLDKLSTQIDETERGVARAWHYTTNAYDRKLDIQIAIIEQVFRKELEKLDRLHMTPSDEDFIDDSEPVARSPNAGSFSEGSAVFTESEEEAGVEDDGSGVGLEESEEEESEEESEQYYDVDASDFSEEESE